jgi:uncharacterized protein (TIGR02246 family)
MRRLSAGVATLAVVVLAVLAYGALNAPTQGQAPGGSASPSDRAADRAALARLVKDFVAAFEQGDAATAASFLTDGAETMAADGTGVAGRAAVQKAFADVFAKDPKHSVKTESGSLRFLSRDTALEEGEMTVKAGSGEPAHYRYVFLFVREDGRWKIAVLRNDDSDRESIKDLEWLIGTWSAKGADAEATTSYEWSGDKAFIRGRFSVREKDKSVTGEQMIGVDPVTGVLRTWTFEADGGVGEGTCERDGKRWVFETTATLADGRVMTATNVMTPIDNDSFTWHPVNLTVDDEPAGSLAPVKVVRVKARQ